MKFDMPINNNPDNMEKTLEEPEEVGADKVVDDETKRFSEFSEEVEGQEAKAEREAAEREGISVEEFKRRKEYEKSEAERENLSEDDTNEMKVEAAKKELELDSGVMEFQKIENLISENKSDKAEKEIKKVRNKLNMLMQGYKPEYHGKYDGSLNKVAEGARLLLHTEVLNLCRQFPQETKVDQVKSKELEMETLYDSARFQEDSEWVDKSGMVTDCELALELYKNINEIKKEDIEAEQEYRKWGKVEMMKNELNRILEEAKKEIEKEQE